MPVTPLGKNTRLEVEIKPWGLLAADGTRPAEPIYGLWFTRFDPLYSSVQAIEMETGKSLGSTPDSLIKLAIFEASRWVDGVAIAHCGTVPNEPYFHQVRWRYVTLRALLSLINGVQGISPVARKALGDFEIEFNTRDGDTNPISRIRDEIQQLESVIFSKGCLGIGASLGPVPVVKGGCDPYRPLFSRTWGFIPPGSPGAITGTYSPRYNRGTRLPDRWYRSNGRGRGR